MQHTNMAAIGRAKGERTVGDGRKGEGKGERKKGREKEELKGRRRETEKEEDNHVDVGKQGG